LLRLLRESRPRLTREAGGACLPDQCGKHLKRLRDEFNLKGGGLN
jgi:hypothetical protein